MAGGAKYGKCNERQEQCVKPGNHRHACDAGVAEHLRNIDRRQIHARQDVPGDPVALNGPHSREQVQPHRREIMPG
jgi:hypothetical protein